MTINPTYDLCGSQEHQQAVVNCLEDPDDTLKLKTLELLYKMTRTNNVEVCGCAGCISPVPLPSLSSTST